MQLSKTHKENLSSQAPYFEAGLQGLSSSKKLAKLKVSELNILLALAKNKPGLWVPLQYIRDHSEESSSSFSRSISKLSEHLHFISIRKEAGDARNKEIRISNKGRATVKPFARAVGYLSNGTLEAEPIPITTKRRYLTGKAALNIPSREGTGDWHFFETFQGSHGRQGGPFFVAKEGSFDTYKWLGNYGIEDKAKEISQAGVKAPKYVFAANHYRAMVDMIYQRLQDGLGLDSYSIEDWFPSEEHKTKLKEVLEKILPALSSEQTNTFTLWKNSQSL